MFAPTFTVLSDLGSSFLDPVNGKHKIYIYNHLYYSEVHNATTCLLGNGRRLHRVRADYDTRSDPLNNARLQY